MGGGSEAGPARMADGYDLVSALRQLEDERAVLDTLYAYGHGIDYGLEGDWIDCFTPEAVYDLRYRLRNAEMGERQRRYAGRVELATFIAGHTRAPDRWHKHLLCEPRVTVSGEFANVASYSAGGSWRSR